MSILGVIIMSRAKRLTREPEIVALSIIALRSFAAGAIGQSDFEIEMAASLSSSGVTPEIASRLVRNFDNIRPSVRLRMLGPLGASDATLPNRLVKGSRTLNSAAKSEILRPGLIPVAGRQILAAGLQAAEIVGGAVDAGTAQGGDGQIAAVGVADAVGHLDALEDAVLAPERFSISFQGIHCIDETGVDFLGSDEIYILTSAVHIKSDGTNEVRTERHPIGANGSGIYGDVDSHETRIGPVASCWSALVDDMQLGMSLTTVVMEHDQGDPDAYRDEVDAAVKLAIAAATYLFPPGGALLALIEASGLITDLFNWVLGTGDDEVGTTTVVLGSLSELENYSRTGIGHLWVVRDGQRVDTGLPNHFVTPVNERDYFAGYVVTRQPRAPLFPIIID